MKISNRFDLLVRMDLIIEIDRDVTVLNTKLYHEKSILRENNVCPITGRGDLFDSSKKREQFSSVAN